MGRTIRESYTFGSSLSSCPQSMAGRNSGYRSSRQQWPGRLDGHKRLCHDHVSSKYSRGDNGGRDEDMATTSRSDDLIASYSSKGPTLIDHVVKPDLVAPGNIIVSALAPMQLSGIAILRTSYRSPITSSTALAIHPTSTSASVERVWQRRLCSGAAALMIQRQPQITPDQVKARLMKTAIKAFPSSSTYTDPATGQTIKAHTTCSPWAQAIWTSGQH